MFGDAALHRYTVVTTLHPKGGGAPVAQEQRYLDVLRREADGRWRVSHHVFNLGQSHERHLPPEADSDGME